MQHVWVPFCCWTRHNGMVCRWVGHHRSCARCTHLGSSWTGRSCLMHVTREMSAKCGPDEIECNARLENQGIAFACLIEEPKSGIPIRQIPKLAATWAKVHRSVSRHFQLQMEQRATGFDTSLWILYLYRPYLKCCADGSKWEWIAESFLMVVLEFWAVGRVEHKTHQHWVL